MFSLQIERKRSEEYLEINLAVERKRFSCFEFIFIKHPEAGLKQTF